MQVTTDAVQLFGGAGYTRDHDVEQHWRDQRLNPIHEGTHGIQATDLLGRKVVMEGGAGLKLLASRINSTIERAGQVEGLAEPANALAQALAQLAAATKAAWATGDPQDALPNATPYLQAFGHVVLAWIWLDVALSLGAAHDTAFAEGKRAAMRYFFRYELPKIGAWLIARIMGRINVPTGSTCLIGLSVSRPMRSAVGSPRRRATRPCATSWNTMAMTKGTSQVATV